MKKPKLIEILGGYQTTSRLTDENLQLLHLYLCLTLLQSSEEIKRRGLGEGEEIYIRIAKPES